MVSAHTWVILSSGSMVAVKTAADLMLKVVQRNPCIGPAPRFSQRLELEKSVWWTFILLVNQLFCLWEPRRSNTAYANTHICEPLHTHVQTCLSLPKQYTLTRTGTHIRYTHVHTHSNAVLPFCLRCGRDGCCSSGLFPLSKAF